MNERLRDRAERLRSAMRADDFCEAARALDAYAAEMALACRSEPDAATQRKLRQDWQELVVWIRSMAATSRENARGQWLLLQNARLYATRKAKQPSMVSERG